MCRVHANGSLFIQKSAVLSDATYRICSGDDSGRVVKERGNVPRLVVVGVGVGPEFAILSRPVGGNETDRTLEGFDQDRGPGTDGCARPPLASCHCAMQNP
eukprot:gene9546-biopygen12233